MKTVSTTYDKRRREPIATRLSATEMTAVDAAAKAAGLNRSGWLRQAALAWLSGPAPSTDTAGMTVVLGEVLALRMIVLNLLPAAHAGLTHAQVLHIMAYADTAKQKEAVAMLSRSDCGQ